MPRKATKVAAKHSQTVERRRRAFADEYLRNGFNATRAYQSVYPGAKATAAATNAHNLLRDANVKGYLGPRLDAAFKAAQMSGDEALARMARAGRLNVPDLFDKAGKMLNPADWPTDLAGCVRAIAHGPNGVKVTFVDPLSAQRTILEVTGKLKNPIAAGFKTLAQILTGDFTQDEDV